MVIVGAVAPRFMRLLQHARQQTCLANVRRIALATLEYAHDWDERLPPAPRVPLERSLAEGKVLTRAPDLARYFPPDDWHRQIRYQNAQVFVCPSSRSIYSYEFNAQVYSLRAPGGVGAPRGPDDLKDPAVTLMEYEAGFITGNPQGRHEKGYYVSFCDGHIDWMQRFDPNRFVIPPPQMGR